MDQTANMEEPQRPPPPKRQITLKLSNLPSASSASLSATTPTVSSPAPQTPSQGPPKIKLVRKSLPSTPIDTKPIPVPKLSVNMPPPPPPSQNGETGATRKTPTSAAKTKFGRTMKPSSKRRAEEDVGGAEDGRAARGAGGPPKKIKLTTATATATATATTPKPVPNIKVKSKTTGKAPYRPPGDGYDSEAEDREVDPTIEEQFVLRMYPGEHCEYIRKCVEERKFGLSRKEGGADFQLKWLDDETRRCLVTVQGQPYAAVLLDLPTITESNKTWDKKSLVKSADICQILLVISPVKNEDEAKAFPLPKPVEPGYRWPHGLTPPMHDCRNRRFRKRLSKLEIQNKEAEVERLLAADKAAVTTTIEWVDEDDAGAAVPNGEAGEIEEEEDDDADGEFDDYFGDAEVELQQNDEDVDFDDALLEAEFEEAPDTPADAMGLAPAPQSQDALTPATVNTGTPTAHTEESSAEADAVEEESGDEEEDEEEGDEGDVDGDGDEDNRDEVAGVRLEIATLKKQLAKCEEDLAKSNAPIMRRRLEDRIRSIKSEIQLKKSSINEVDDD